MVTSLNKKRPVSKGALLGENFDPWYVPLSPPENAQSSKPSLLSRPQLPVRTVNVDYTELAHSAKLRAKEIIRERWREIRNASDGSLLYYAETEPPEGAAL